jgi:hypothetical protein
MHQQTPHPRLLLPLAFLIALPAFVSPAAAVSAPSLAPGATGLSSSQFAADAFASVWTRTDSLVASGAARRTWFWGPQPNTAGLMEAYAEGANGKRLVQYFDKSRMEINNPNGDPSAPFYVTNGLLTVELISGRMQTGNNTFVARQPSQTNVTGDPGDLLSPTYADLAGVSNALGAKPDADRTGHAVTATLSRDGKVGDDPTKANVPGVEVVYYEKSSGHNIPKIMWDFLDSSGQVSVGGQTAESRLIDPWFYASGLPISDAYWVRATIAGKPTDVLLQAYERRVLTYVPTNPDGFKVEMGNIGQHYYDWRYKEVPAPTPTPTPMPTSPAHISRYAVDLVGDTSAATLDRVKSIGADTVRLQLSWNFIEPQNVPPAQYNWAPIDEIYKALSDRGLQPISLVEGCPGWACTRLSGPVREEHVADFVEFMTAMSARYSKPPYNAHFWEMWNEPDAVGDAVPGTDKHYGWGSNADRYAAMLKAIRPAVKGADPSAALVLGGMAYDGFQENGGAFNRRFIDDLLNAGGGQYLDVLNFHYYPNNVNWCSLTGKLNELRGKMKAHGVNLPFITTETGFSSDPKLGSSNDAQSLYVLQAYAQTAGEGMLTTAWFPAHDFTASGNIFEKFGLFTESGAPKPASTAYKVASSKIGSRPAVRALGEGDGLSGSMRGYEFGSDTQHQGKLWVLWAWDQNGSGKCGSPPAPTGFNIPANLVPRLAHLLNMYGQPINPHSRADGGLVFSLDAKPVYLEWEQ